ncbi:MAG: nucleotide sugar dehydrogenase [Ignavibacteria bacterium]|jgi:UDP-N-acetyl-D-glucosamine dehydrogenase|nr:nucleotide sugar dehydrogenase [Ignavibacteria bacterium]MDH7527389.1 nucleotide sugar dehydrogenase [Ignavibacteria bacterium]
MKNLEQKIKSKKAVIGVVGLGYVGLPLAVEFALKGFKTIGIDLSKWKVEKINKGENYIQDVNDKDLEKVVKKGLLTAYDNYTLIPEIDVIYICVPTPFTENKDPDITFIEQAAEEISKGLRKDHLVILKSTTFPNTTEGVVQPILEKSGLKVGKDFYLAFSPERIDPGNKIWTTKNTPVVVGGVTKKCTELAALANSQIIEKVVKVSNPKVAEMEKLLENIFRSVNIALVNEMALLCDRMGGINVWEVIEAASTKPFGFMPFYPGPGIGGHCILIDPYYLEWQARSYDFVTHFIRIAAETNENMPFYVKHMILREISQTDKSIQNSKILFLGAAFKKDVDDTRHSPAIKVMELLLKDFDGLNLCYNDPYVPEIEVNGLKLKSVNLTKKLLKEMDLVVITTNHSIYNYDFIVQNSKKVIDTRNATKNVKKNREKIVLLGSGSKKGYSV